MRAAARCDPSRRLGAFNQQLFGCMFFQMGYCATKRLQMTSTSDRIEKQIVLKAPRARVWKALTDTREFGAWFGVELRGEFKEGETLRGKITTKGYTHVTW